MWVTTAGRKLVAVNGAAGDLLGFDPAELVGEPATRLFVPSEWERLHNDRSTLRPDRPCMAERTLCRADGRRIRARCATRLQLAGGREFVVTVVRAHQLVPDGFGRGRLTSRELEMIEHVSHGKRVHEIADELYLAPSTVQTHLRNAMEKVGARSQAQLVACALRDGLLDD